MAAGKTLDLFKAHKAEYAAKRTAAVVDTRPARYLAVAGRGEPGGEAFQAAIGALYSVAFTIKMTRKFAGKGDYKVCPLEALWWGGRSAQDFLALPRDEWQWKLLIRTPDFIEAADLKAAQSALREKRKPPGFEKVRLETLDEGRCVQILHVGPYADEPASVAQMEAFAREQGLKFRGRHHEVYLSDPRRAAPERLRTILRHPVQ